MLNLFMRMGMNASGSKRLRMTPGAEDKCAQNVLYRHENCVADCKDCQRRELFLGVAP